MLSKRGELIKHLKRVKDHGVTCPEILMRLLNWAPQSIQGRVLSPNRAIILTRLKLRLRYDSLRSITLRHMWLCSSLHGGWWGGDGVFVLPHHLYLACRNNVSFLEMVAEKLICFAMPVGPKQSPLKSNKYYIVLCSLILLLHWETIINRSTIPFCMLRTTTRAWGTQNNVWIFCFQRVLRKASKHPS